MGRLRSEESGKLFGLTLLTASARASGLLSRSAEGSSWLDSSARQGARPELQPGAAHVLQPAWESDLSPFGHDGAANIQEAEMGLFYGRGGPDDTAEDESDVDSSLSQTREYSQLIRQWSDDNRSLVKPGCLEACEASKAQCKEKACDGVELQEPPFKHCAPPDAERPRMLYAKGCSGSTWVQKVARELMRLHGFCVSPVAYEPLNPTSDVKRLFSYDNATIGDSMQRATEYWGKQGATLVYKGVGGLDSVFVRKKMKRLGTYAAVVWRSNALDHAVCMVRDCFSDKLGYAVDEHGSETQICFQRRKAPDADTRSYKVKLNMTNLLRQLAYMTAQGQRLEDDLKASDYRDVSMITYEDLADYQRRDSQWANSTEAFDRAVEAWGSLLRSWGVTPVYKTIMDYLLSGKGTRDPPRSHSDMIYNYEEVRDMIQRELRNWPEFEGLLRL